VIRKILLAFILLFAVSCSAKKIAKSTTAIVTSPSDLPTPSAQPTPPTPTPLPTPTHSPSPSPVPSSTPTPSPVPSSSPTPTPVPSASPNPSGGKIITAANPTLLAVRAAVALAVAGDIVKIPVGSAPWSSTLVIDKAITVMGAGMNATTISGNGHSLVRIEPPHDGLTRLSGIRFNIGGWSTTDGQYPIDVKNGGITRIDHCYFEEGQYVVTYSASEGVAYGLNDHNTYHNPDNAIQMGGNTHIWDFPIVPGTQDMMVIEDNTFLADKTGNGDNNEAIMSGQGVRFVVRHNLFDGRNFDDNYLPYENHGQGNLYTGTDEDLRGPPIFEIYENTMIAKRTYRFMHIRGGSCLVYNNHLTLLEGTNASPIVLTEDFALTEPAHFPTWAGEDQINNSFFWGNTINNSPITEISLYDDSLIRLIQEGRDYWMHPPDDHSGKTIWTDRPGSRNETFVSGRQAYFPYVPLPYPHPLSKQAAPSAPAFNGYESWMDQSPLTSTRRTIDVPPGSFVVVASSVSGSGQFMTVTSPGFAFARDLHDVDSDGDSLDIASAANAPGGPTSITVSVPNAAYIRVVVAWYSGMGTNPIAHKMSSRSGLGQTASAGSVTTTMDNSILFVAARTNSDLQGWSAGSGFKIRNNCNAELEPDQKLCIQDQGPVSMGTYSGAFSINSDLWVAGLVAYAPGSSP
jgi:hypothetical protein